MTTDFATFVQERFGGVLTHGSHSPDGAACFMEALNLYQGREWSDSTKGTLDLRSLNDAPWSSDQARTDAMLPLGAIVLAWPKWSAAKRQKFAKRVATETIRQILPPTLRALAARVPKVAPDLIAAALRCETTPNAESAAAAWSAAESAAAEAWPWSAAWSAESATRSATAAWSAAAEAWPWSAATATDAPLITLCEIFVAAAK